jgi:tRNA (guanine37-N1)-methyltransferase
VRLDVFTLFPEAFVWFAQQVHINRARSLGVELSLWDYRATTPLKHGQVDDTPYGGGAGMVLRIDVVWAALEAAFERDPASLADTRRVVELTPRGRQLDDALATELAGGDLCVLCGRYEGIDERVSHLVTDRVSVGPYVLSGGEIAAQVLLDAVVRKIHGAVSNPASVAGDSFAPDLGGALEYPQYTRPAEFHGWSVPPVLLSGDHGAVDDWRRERLVGGEGPR